MSATNSGQGEEARTTMTDPMSTGSVRCLLFVEPSSPAPVALVEGLRRRGADVGIVSDAPTAIAELAEATNVVLIVYEPDRHDSLPRLCTVIRRYLPRTHLWQCAQSPPNGKPQLRPLAEQLDGEHEEALRPTNVIDDQPESLSVEAPLVSQEELAMLFGDEEKTA